MSIEMPAAEVFALADRLSAAAEEADDAGARLGGPAEVGRPLQAAVDAFLDGHRVAAAAMAGELRWLGTAVASVAASWLALDAALLAPDGEVP
jgi:hypothetical protein